MHLTDEQLNEYLDGETPDRAEIEHHLSGCETCSLRLAALRELFLEIGSLGDVQLSPDFDWQKQPVPRQRAPLPRPLTAAMSVQVLLAGAGLVAAAPAILQRITSFGPSIAFPSALEMFVQLQGQWGEWVGVFRAIRLPDVAGLAVLNLSSLFTLFTIVALAILWILGNSLLLRNHRKSTPR